MPIETDWIRPINKVKVADRDQIVVVKPIETYWMKPINPTVDSNQIHIRDVAISQPEDYSVIIVITIYRNGNCIPVSTVNTKQQYFRENNELWACTTMCIFLCCFVSKRAYLHFPKLHTLIFIIVLIYSFFSLRICQTKTNIIKLRSVI